MKTYIVYSKKPLKFISSFEDIAKLKFVKYGFDWWYFIDFVNILYALKRNFVLLAVMYVVVYFLISNANIQFAIVTMVAFLAYAMEGFFLRRRKYDIIATIEARNAKQAKEFFLRENLVDGRKIVL